MLKAEKYPDTARTARPCQALRQTLSQLLKEKELEKITVTELCRSVRINRSTFYEYYDDIYDLMKDVETDFLEKTDHLCSYIADHTLNPETVTMMILEFISQEQELLLLFLSNYRYTSFLKEIHERVLHLFRIKLTQNYVVPETISTEKLENAILFLSSGFYSVYLGWLKSGCSQDPQQLASQSAALSQACLDALFTS